VVVLDSVRAVAGGSAVAAADPHEALGDVLVVGTAERDVVQGPRAARSAAAIAPTRRAVLEPERLDTLTFTVPQRGGLTSAPAAAAFLVVVSAW